MIKLTNILNEEQTINEATPVSFKELDAKAQNKVKYFERVIGGKQIAIFHGIHGHIVDIKKSSVGGEYRFDASQLNQLLMYGIRWVEGGKNKVTIGF